MTSVDSESIKQENREHSDRTNKAHREHSESTQKAHREHSKSTHRAREQSDFIIPSEPKLLRLVYT